jgi:hypothetical protein
MLGKWQTISCKKEYNLLNSYMSCQGSLISTLHDLWSFTVQKGEKKDRQKEGEVTPRKKEKGRNITRQRSKDRMEIASRPHQISIHPTSFLQSLLKASQKKVDSFSFMEAMDSFQ